mgnify:CR=1 FL=1
MKENWIFFGTDDFAVDALAELNRHDWSPALVITTPNTTYGRGLKLSPPPVKVWAEDHGLKTIQPTTTLETKTAIQNLKPQFALVVAYGRILPAEIFFLPKRGTINLHPSLLPKYRGPAPIQTAIINGDTETGVTVMLVDEKVDHGPIIAQTTYNLEPITYNLVGKALAKLGAELLVKTIPDWLASKIKPREQNHNLASFTKKIKKEDGEIKLTDNPELNWRKFRAYTPNPGSYFFTDDGTRVKITAAEFKHGEFIITRVIPANKKEMPYPAFLRGHSS